MQKGKICWPDTSVRVLRNKMVLIILSIATFEWSRLPDSATTRETTEGPIRGFLDEFSAIYEELRESGLRSASKNLE